MMIIAIIVFVIGFILLAFGLSERNEVKKMITYILFLANPVMLAEEGRLWSIYYK